MVYTIRTQHSYSFKFITCFMQTMFSFPKKHAHTHIRTHMNHHWQSGGQYSLRFNIPFLIIVIGVVHKILLPLTRLSQLHSVVGSFSSNTIFFCSFFFIFSYFSSMLSIFFRDIRIPKFQSIVKRVCVRFCMYVCVRL